MEYVLGTRLRLVSRISATVLLETPYDISVYIKMYLNVFK